MLILKFFLVFISTFIFMEFMAWFSHKYIMHGFLWSWHKDHHVKNKESWFEKNDRFFIFCYGLTYFFVHDVFIHQRFKFLKKTNNKYAKALRRAHKMHHKNINKEGCESFGMLWIPFKYFKEL